MREIDAVAPPLVPFLYLDQVIRAGQRTGVGRYAAETKPARIIPRDRWPEVLERAQGESLRRIAREFGVSHETVRAVLRSAAH